MPGGTEGGVGARDAFEPASGVPRGRLLVRKDFRKTYVEKYEEQTLREKHA